MQTNTEFSAAPETARLPRLESPLNSPGEISAQLLSPASTPANWADWQVQIKQMIPGTVTTPRHVIYDWAPSMGSVDVYAFDVRNSKLTPLARIENPDLAFSRRMEDAVAKVDDSVANAIRDIASSGHRLVGIGPVIVYKNKQLQSPKMFGPTIDTLMMAAVIDQKVSLDGKDQSVLEVGTGNGLIAKMLLSKFHANLEKLFVSDLSAVVLNDAARNILSLDLPESEKDKLVTVRDPTFLKSVAPASLSLIVSNPPYIPDFRAEDSAINKAITGLGVYDAILGPWGHAALKDGGKAIVILSSVSARGIRESAAKHDCFEECGVLAQKLVPFDLAEVNLDSSYLNRLLGDQLVFDIDSRLYHLVEVVEFEKKEKRALPI